MILKICGITNAEDAEAAIAGGATALGFNFYLGSPRYIDPERAAEIVTPRGVLRVGVFVNQPPEKIRDAARIARIDVAQLHGNERRQDYPKEIPVWKAANVTTGFDFAWYAKCRAQAIVLDGPAGQLYGGSGRSFDWSLAAGLQKRIIVAGGLSASNVAQAIALARPWGVDACSRLESAPGKKDLVKMAAFLSAARKAALHV